MSDRYLTLFNLPSNFWLEWRFHRVKTSCLLFEFLDFDCANQTAVGNRRIDHHTSIHMRDLILRSMAMLQSFNYYDDMKKETEMKVFFYWALFECEVLNKSSWQSNRRLMIHSVFFIFVLPLSFSSMHSYAHRHPATTATAVISL